MTIRLKLTMASVAAILVANTILSLATVYYVAGVWRQEVQTRLRLDLRSARTVYDNRIAGIERFLTAAALHRVFLSGSAENDGDEAGARLRTLHEAGGMDMVAWLDARGRVVFRAHNPAAHGDDLSDNPIVAAAVRERMPARGTLILSPEELTREGEALAERARFALLETPAAKPTEDRVRAEGMVMAVAVPAFDREGNLAGLLYGSDLLNRRYEIVDAIRDEVFAHDVYGGETIGTVTLFQGDLRISTNVRRTDGERAVGTRLSSRVHDAVLTGGEVFADRAFVVNDWYITAYEPIRDPAGQVIGALYVGLLEAPFAHRRAVIVGAFLGIVGAATLVSLVLLFFVAKHVLQPMGRIASMCRRVIGGDLTARVGIRPPGEMGELCAAIDAMGQAVAEREAQLKQATREQIGRSEQLAAIGRLAAGIAHEINNPLTGVLTFAHLLREKENIDPQDRQDLDLIVNETTRVREIVRGLLDFARERPVEREWLNINEVVRQTMRLVRSQKQFQQIVVEERLADGLPWISADRNQIQQVLLNLSLNACEAMSGGGTLTVATSAGDRTVIITVSDTGSGIKPEHLGQIYEPFFTTKPVGTGTGLGLSVSYGIVEHHGGHLEVESEDGRGATFRIILPATDDGGTRTTEDTSKP
ncbi:MAG: cache domain-containing protein [Phycisphaerae bacterium]|nr:cache domain-containing protein [Phycisphaerae bacterium]